jgi:hypothetical protein
VKETPVPGVRKEAVAVQEKQNRMAEESQQLSALSAPLQPPLQEETMQRLLQRFVTAYQQGDLENFLTLFSADARTNDYAGKPALREDYARFFTVTQARELQLEELQWRFEGNTAQGKGRYVVRVRKPTRTVESRGQIYFQVQERAGTSVITGLFNTVEN